MRTAMRYVFLVLSLLAVPVAAADYRGETEDATVKLTDSLCLIDDRHGPARVTVIDGMTLIRLSPDLIVFVTDDGKVSTSSAALADGPLADALRISADKARRTCQTLRSELPK